MSLTTKGNKSGKICLDLDALGIKEVEIVWMGKKYKLSMKDEKVVMELLTK